MKMDTEILRKKLETEKVTLEEELSTVGIKNPKIKGDWSPKAHELGIPGADKNEMGDIIEDFEESTATENELEERLGAVNRALEKIENGTYGVCRVCGKEIEGERQSANPAAETCIAHKNE